jgi:hypothetical protein
MKASLWGIFMGLSMAFSLSKEGGISDSSANASIVTEVLTIIAVSLPSFL